MTAPGSEMLPVVMAVADLWRLLWLPSVFLQGHRDARSMGGASCQLCFPLSYFIGSVTGGNLPSSFYRYWTDVVCLGPPFSHLGRILRQKLARGCLLIVKSASSKDHFTIQLKTVRTPGAVTLHL